MKIKYYNVKCRRCRENSVGTGEYYCNNCLTFEKKLKGKHPTLFRLMFEPLNKGVPRWSICRGFECQEGWNPLLEELCEKIQIELDKLEDVSEFYAVQVKEKFGSLRFYMNESNDAIEKHIEEAKNKSATTCEKCSKPGTIEAIGNYLNCFCDIHKEERLRQVIERDKKV